MDGSNWMCKKGAGSHALGIVEQRRANGRSSERLMLYRHAVDLSADQPAEVDVIAVIEGFSPTVKCDVCGAERTWWPGEAAMERLLERMQEMRSRMKIKSEPPG